MYQVFTDGSSSRKNGTMGTSYIVFKNEDRDNPIKIFSKGFIDKQARNGIAELLGIYYFLYDICCIKNGNCYINKEEEIIIYSDSQYAINEFTIWFKNQIIKNFFDTKNKEIIIYVLWILCVLRQEGYKIKFRWIRGHQKEENFEVYGNNLADSLAVNCHKNLMKNENIEDFIAILKKEIKSEKIFEFIKKSYLGI